jgi:hypothetical protein
LSPQRCGLSYGQPQLPLTQLAMLGQHWLPHSEGSSGVQQADSVLQTAASSQ